MFRRLLARVWKPSWRKRGNLPPARKRSGEAKIAVRQVDHSYNRVEALRDISIDIHPGEFVCLLGPSGCGKTTLLQALAGSFVPTYGRISIDGKPVKGPDPNRLLMFQEPALFPWLTVKQNLMFALRTRYRSRKRREEKAMRFINRVHLDGFEDALPHQLSGGMRMRVSLARALAMDPAVLLMDEPFGGLDAQTKGHMHQLLQQVWVETRKTVVFVTHDVREALVLGDRVVVMAARPGRILKDLEVRLPRPRDPDDEAIVQHSRQIREALRRAEEAGEPMIRPGTEAGQRHAKDLGGDPAGGVPAGPAHPMGAGG